MNNQEAALLLQAYRPNGQDADDPRFAQALERARRDPALGRWFAEQQDFDRAISERLRGLPTPPQLKEELLAIQVLTRPRVWDRLGAWLSLAASIALAVLVALNWRIETPPVDFAAYRAAIVPLAAEVSPHLEHHDTDLAPLVKALTQAGAPAPTLASLPPALRHLPPLGCRVIDWQGHKVSLICYLKDGHELHLLVVRRDGFQGVPPAEIPSVARNEAWSTACWVDKDAIYLLAAKVPPAVLQRYL